MIATAMILAAGRGHRLRPMTDTRPKPLLDVAGRTLIERHFSALRAAGVARVVVNVSWLAEQIVGSIAAADNYGLDVIFSHEGPEALETAGGIVRALPFLGAEPFWVVNADVFTDYSFGPLELNGAALAHLLLVANPKHNRNGDFDVSDEGRLQLPDSAASHTGVPYTYCGIGVYRPEFFHGLDDGKQTLAPLLHAHAADGRVSATIFNGTWDDIGTPARLERRQRLESGR